MALTLTTIKEQLASSISEPPFIIQNAVIANRLQIGKIYATRGGVALIEENDELHLQGWGFEHVRFIEVADTITIETEWSPNLQVPLTYTFYVTTDQRVYSPFPLLGLHLNKMQLSLSQAVDLKLFNTTSPKMTAVSKKEEIDGVTKRAIIKYFKTPRKISDAAESFSMQYRQMRSIVFGIEDRGFETKRYKLKRLEDSNGKLMIQLIER